MRNKEGKTGKNPLSCLKSKKKSTKEPVNKVQQTTNSEGNFLHDTVHICVHFYKCRICNDYESKTSNVLVT